MMRSFVSMSNVTVRSAAPDDLDAICAIYDRVVSEARWLGTEPGYDAQERRERWKRQLERDTNGWFVACIGRTVAGAISVHEHEEYGLMLGMFVDAQYRAMGIGRALLEASIEWTRATGSPQLSLLVFSHNDTAIRLYERCGFVEREYYKDDVTRQNGEVWDTILMVRRLN